MRFMDAANTMVPIAACSNVPGNDSVPFTSSMLSLALPSYDIPLTKSQNGNKSSLLDSSVAPLQFAPENGFTFNPWLPPVKESLLSQNARDTAARQGCVLPASTKNAYSSNAETRGKESSFTSNAASHYINLDKQSVYNKDFKSQFPASYFPCRLPNVPMNGAEKLVMTGSSNPRAEHLNWLCEVVSSASKGTLNRHSSSPNQNEVNASSSRILHGIGDNTSSLLLPNSGSVFIPPVVVARPVDGSSLRMFTPPFQVERSRHVQHASVPVAGTGTALYYSQAPRTLPYSNFFPATYSSSVSYPATTPQSTITSASVNTPESGRSFLQADNYSSLSNVHTIGSSSSQLSCSPAYLSHSQSSSSPTNIGVPSPHGRLFQQGRSILISRSPEGMIVQSPHERDSACHVRIQLSPTLPQSQDDSSRRKSFTSDSVLGSSSCSPIIETAQSSTNTSDFSVSKEYIGQRTSPSHLGYRVPTGKEGSLKHRILRPPSINILDPPQSVVADAPLSAPPIRTHREPSPKQARSIPSSGYRSFSSSASSITEVSNRVTSSGTSPGIFPNHCSSFSSGSPSPAPPNSPGTAAQLKYPQSFMKGAIIQLANNQLKQVEDMTTEDFIECGLLSPTLKIDSSTVVSIEKTPSTGAAKLGFHVGEDNIQITVEAPLEHPFFVYKQGWSSCSPERSAQRYGLACHKLKVGDVCISLTEKPQTSVNIGQKVSSLSVPSSNAKVTVRNQNSASGHTIVNDETKETTPQAIRLPSKLDSPSEKQSISSVDKSLGVKSETRASSGKRKRRWSAPDNLSQNDDATSSS